MIPETEKWVGQHPSLYPPECRETYAKHFGAPRQGAGPAPQPTPGMKPTNPKDAIGGSKLPLNLVPDTVGVYAAMAFAEGASKYGAYNWRVAGVRMSIYMAAMRRHQKKLWNGEWADPKTRVPHLASIIACAGIIADAKLCDKLVDDRPPAADIARLIAEAEEVVVHLYEMHKDKTPHHCTINDTESLQ